MSDLHVTKAREIRLKSLQTIQEANFDHGSQQKETTAINELSDQFIRLKEEKLNLIEETKRKIDEEKNAWETQKQAYIETAQKEGYEKGFQTGKTDSLESYKTLIEKANTIVRQTEIDYQKEMEQNEESIVQLAVLVSEKIIRETLKEQPESFISIVKMVLSELKEAGRITIFLHPDNYEYVFQQKEELIRLLEETKKISIYADETLPVNSCIVEHPTGQIDANIDTQLEQIRTALLKVGSSNGT